MTSLAVDSHSVATMTYKVGIPAMTSLAITINIGQWEAWILMVPSWYLLDVAVCGQMGRILIILGK